MFKKTQIQISGIHCRSCKTLIETEVGALKNVKNIKVNHQTGESWVEFDDEKISLKEIFAVIEKLNYKVKKKINTGKNNQERTSKKEDEQKNNFKQFIIVGVFLVLTVLAYFLIKYFDLLQILSHLNERRISYWLIFLIGFLVSFHCLGMCGGLVVTYTARHRGREKEKINLSLPHLQYNAGRLISYTVIGGILGGIGSFFGINPSFTGTVTLIAGTFMILIGLSLLVNFKWVEMLKPRTPAFIARFLYGQRHTRKPKGPFIIGLLNGFMPCGPLQAMQIYALASGSIIRGALSMSIYAAGTIPLMFGFGSFISFLSAQKIKQVMKISGAVVMVLGLFMFNRGLINFGYGFKSFLPQGAVSQTEYLVTGDIKEYQNINMDLTYRGYSPNILYIKKGIPVRWVINVKQMSGCMDAIMIKSLGIKKDLQMGENIIEFTPPKNMREIKFSCWMEMVWGKFVVLSGDEVPASGALKEPIIEGSACNGSGSCGGTCGRITCGCGKK